MDPAEQLRCLTKNQQLVAMNDFLRRENILLKLQSKQCIGRAPTAEEFDCLNYQQQKWWTEKFPALKRFSKSPEKSTYPCGWVFPDHTECNLDFKTKREAKECRKWHIAYQRNGVKETGTPITPTPAPQPQAQIVTTEQDAQYEVSQCDTPSSREDHTFAQASETEQD